MLRLCLTMKIVAMILSHILNFSQHSFFFIMRPFRSKSKCNKCMLKLYVSSVSTRGKVIWWVERSPLGGSHTVITVLYCTTAEKHPTLYRADSVLQQSPQAVGWPQDSCKVQDRYFSGKDKAGQSAQGGLGWENKNQCFWWLHDKLLCIKSDNIVSCVTHIPGLHWKRTSSYTIHLYLCVACWAYFDVEVYPLRQS